jgi:hypothetical protein
MLHTFSLPLALREAPPTNRHRLYSIAFQDANDLAILRRTLNGLIISELFGQPLVCPACFQLDELDALIPETPENSVMTMTQYRKLMALVGAIAILQARQEEPILGGYSRAEIGIALSRFFLLPMTTVRPLFA